jgi:hypothetical protein
MSDGSANGPTAKFSTLVVWCNVFIPDAKVSALDMCFRGDDRGFDSSVSARSRLHARTTVAGLGTTSASMGDTDIHCGETAKLDCESGQVLETATAVASGGFANFHCGNTYPDPEGGVYDTANQYVANLTLDVVASDPLVLAAPTVGGDLMFTIDAVAGSVQVKGAIDHWPAFEGYASADGGSPVTLFQVTPASGTDPFSLMQPRDTAVDVTVQVA